MMALSIGSFLNVVIHRGPVIWGLVDAAPKSEKLSLATPASHCPACKTPIRLQHLLPVVSYLALGGKCATCQHKISPRYLAIEVAAAAVALLALLVWGLTPQALAAFVFFALLLAMAVIDHETTYLPDALTLPLIALGLLVNMPHWPSVNFTPLPDALIGATLGYLVFWLIDVAYKKLRGRDGLGRGDAKLLCGLGAWLGWYTLPFIVFISALLALATILASGKAGAQINAQTQIPFGPFLALAGGLLLLLQGTGLLLL